MMKRDQQRIRDLLERNKVPGAEELRSMCEQAQRVAAFCKLMGYGKPERMAEEVTEFLDFTGAENVDGAWILPEEV